MKQRRDALDFRMVAGAAILYLALGAVAVADPTERIQTRTYAFTEADRDQEYQLFVPSTYDASSAAPLIVLLHGLGSNPGQVIRYQGIVDEAENRGYIVVAPFGYNSHGWYGSLGQDDAFAARFRRGRPASEPDPENLGELSEKDVLNVLALIREEYSIDENRIYLMGHSMGGGGTLYLGMKYPDIWAGLAPMAPAIYGDAGQIEKIKSTPVIIIQGEKDRLVRVERVRPWAEKMKELGMTYEYVEIKGGNHRDTIFANPEMIADVYDFLDESIGAIKTDIPAGASSAVADD